MKTISLIILLLYGLTGPLLAQQNSEDAIEGELIEGELPLVEEATAAFTDEEIDGDLEEGSLEEGSLDADIEALKKEVLSLNRDLFILEEDLLFPSNTQFSIFLSMNAGALFSLDSVQLKVDDKNIANHLYTERELAALKRGGVQRLYIGNLPSGEHEIIAIFSGVGPKGRDYRRGESILIEKTTEPQFVEFIIADDTGKEQPQFDVRVWE
ncbi:MAG: AraC family transcriptional regulator [Gammaproteobacteria bacterium]|nr:AraC family transcriptional regulator [Gammaproteobacteria bacterium]